MIKKILFIGLAIFIAGTCLLFALTIKTPIPPDINIFAPDLSLPDEVKALSGKWEGSWSYVGKGVSSSFIWDCTIYVEKVGIDSVQVVHSWGEYSTRRNSCHCAPNWIRVMNARINYSEGEGTIEFLTRPYERLKESNPSRRVSGSVKPSGAHYSFSFTVEKNKPNLMKGHFTSGKGSPLYIAMKKID